MSLTIAGLTFDEHHYDERGDVLYLTVEGYAGPPATALSTPEGHGIDYDATGRVIGMTLTNVRMLLARDGDLTITFPAGHVSARELAAVLPAAA